MPTPGGKLVIATLLITSGALVALIAMPSGLTLYSPTQNKVPNTSSI